MNMFSKSHEDIMNYIYTMLDYFSMLNLINSKLFEKKNNPK